MRFVLLARVALFAGVLHAQVNQVIPMHLVQDPPVLVGLTTAIEKEVGRILLSRAVLQSPDPLISVCMAADLEAGRIKVAFHRDPRPSPGMFGSPWRDGAYQPRMIFYLNLLEQAPYDESLDHDLMRVIRHEYNHYLDFLVGRGLEANRYSPLQAWPPEVARVAIMCELDAWQSECEFACPFGWTWDERHYDVEDYCIAYCTQNREGLAAWARTNLRYDFRFGRTDYYLEVIDEWCGQ